jgi:hypothetical protein
MTKLKRIKFSFRPWGFLYAAFLCGLGYYYYGFGAVVLMILVSINLEFSTKK